MEETTTSETDFRTLKELYMDSKFIKIGIWLFLISGFLALISPYVGGPQFKVTDFLVHIIFSIILVDRILIAKYRLPNRSHKLASLMSRFSEFLIVLLGLMWFYVLSKGN